MDKEKERERIGHILKKTVYLGTWKGTRKTIKKRYLKELKKVANNGEGSLLEDNKPVNRQEKSTAFVL